MAIAPGYRYDLFVSYAHADNTALDREEGWVTQFVRRLEPALRQRLGGAESLRIYFDSSATAANSQLPELITAVKHSALFLAIGSPSYATRDWPRQELETFTGQIPDTSRLFMVECLPLNKDECYPPGLSSYIPLVLWKASGPRNVPMPYSPDAEEFQPLVHSLAADIRDRLLGLRVLPDSHADAYSAGLARVARAGTAGTGSAPVTISRTVLLAQVTDDVEDEADQIRCYLKQYAEEIVVLPKAAYPQGGDAFKTALARDLAQADVLVQLLGRRAGRVPPDLPEGYTRCQFEAAKAAGVQIMQWRHPDLDADAVSDPTYRNILTADTVIASGLEAFKRQVLDWTRRPAPKSCGARPTSVFINADDKDLGIAKDIERECLRQALTTFLPMTGPSSEANRKDLADNLIDCDVLLFIYGNTTHDWIRSQLRFFSKVKPKRETDPKMLAIYSGPPPQKPDIGITFPNARVINSPDGWNIEPIRKLISELTE